MKLPHGSSVANRALELIGTELGMFRSDGPPKPLNPEDLSIEQIRELLGMDAPPEVLPQLRRKNGSCNSLIARLLTEG